ncbi:hypothetical protein C8R43DRAFT_961357 [Mycena crocata]|nr:hypothetical protein C8R43DRAFT_961357 [Mycena crocata]
MKGLSGAGYVAEFLRIDGEFSVVEMLNLGSTYGHADCAPETRGFRSLEQLPRAAHAETVADSPDASDPPGSNISIADLSFTAMTRGTYPKARYYGGDAAGAVYVKSRRAKRTTRPSQTERLPRDISDLELKVGHAKNLPRRVQQYRKCESDAQEIVWHGFFYAERRMHVERRIHLALERHGAVRIRGECRGYPCTTHHREYFTMKTIRKRAEFLRLCRGELRAAGEKDLKLYPMKDWYRISKSRIRKSRIRKSRT